MSLAPALVLREGGRMWLGDLARLPSVRSGLAIRARIVLLLRPTDRRHAERIRGGTVSIGERAKALAVSWADSFFPRGPARDKAAAFAHRRGITFAPSGKPVPAHLRARQISFNTSQQDQLLAALRTHYWGARTENIGSVDAYLATDRGIADCRDHLTERLGLNRSTVVPWLDSIRPLDGLRILEIGAGTGSSTVALAEQGAAVLAVDVSESYLRANEERCRIAGLGSVAFATANADSLSSVTKAGENDMIVIFAALEHMTFDERMAAIRGAWQLLEPGGLLVVIEAPNRLWYFDSHTSLAPFFHWLPDEVAHRYAEYTPREYFNTEFTGGADPVAFARWGRGVSFHDFVLALGMPAARLPAESSMHEYLDLPRWRPHTRDGRFLRFIRTLEPEVPKGFFYEYLDIALRKS
jgi:2-polyprenyl-3-methyl-5-hydroxy-6-metoxy-1,4-benzoquinol methylase